MRFIYSIIAVCLVSVLSACASVASYSQEGQAESIRRTEQQVSVARERIDASGAPVRLIYSGYALDRKSSAFLGDIKTMSKLVNQIDPQNVQLLFSNRGDYGFGGLELPYATEFDLRRGVEATEKLAEQALQHSERAPLLIMLLSSHGGKTSLEIDVDEPPHLLHAQSLALSLNAMDKFPMVLIISSCHSGSFIPVLKGDNRIIITASSSERNSFGCSVDGENTWWVDALAKSFDPHQSLRQWYDRAAHYIEEEEHSFALPASQPQLWVGKNMETYASQEMGQFSSAVTALATNPSGTTPDVGVK